MRRIPAFAFAAAVAVAMHVPPAFGQQGAVPAPQDQAPQNQVPQDQVPQDQGAAPQSRSDPDWPAGLESWDDPEWDPAGDPDQAEDLGLTSPEVERSQMPEPDAQGTRSPKDEDTTQAEEIGLYDALALVRQAPPALDGRPVTRPNPLASEPSSEMEPHPLGNPESLFPETYVE